MMLGFLSVLWLLIFSRLFLQSYFQEKRIERLEKQVERLEKHADGREKQIAELERRMRLTGVGFSHFP